MANRAVSPQQKIIGTNNKFKNDGIKKQQGTTRTIYDTLPLDGRTEFRFFEESSTRQFPFTNQSAEGNKLGVGSTLVIERVYLAVVDVDDLTGDITGIDAILNAAPPGILLGELSIELANSQILKQLTVSSFLPQFNKNAAHTNYSNFEMDTQLVIPPLLEFVFKLRTENYAAAAGQELRLVVEGTGAIIAPRNTF